MISLSTLVKSLFLAFWAVTGGSVSLRKQDCKFAAQADEQSVIELGLVCDTREDPSHMCSVFEPTTSTHDALAIGSIAKALETCDL